jgi:RNA polymerase sigma factor (sigma-70 family)
MDFNRILGKMKRDIIDAVNDNKAICLKFGYNTRSAEIKNHFRQTERRLYNYPLLITNVEKYNLDIKDLQKEFDSGSFGKSKDIVFMQKSGVRLESDEVLEAKILTLLKKIQRDNKEIQEIEYALEVISNDEFKDIIHYKYFENMTDAEIADKLHISDRTVRRYKSRLIGKIMVRLYGADVI